MVAEKREKVVSENTPATGVNVAKSDLARWEEDKFDEKLAQKQEYVFDCVKKIFPEVEELEPLADEDGYDLLIGDWSVGEVLYAYWVNYGTGNRKFYWSTNREICQQVRKARREWLAQKKEAK